MGLAHNPYPELSYEWEAYEDIFLEAKHTHASQSTLSHSEELRIYEVTPSFINSVLKELTKDLEDLKSLLALIDAARFNDLKMRGVRLGWTDSKLNFEWSDNYRFYDRDLKNEMVNIIENIKYLERSRKLLEPKDPKQEELKVEEARLYPISKIYTGQLRESGTNFLGLCPFHKEKTPSFTIHKAKNKFTCYGCGEHGDAIDFYMKLNKVDFATAVRQLT